MSNATTISTVTGTSTINLATGEVIGKVNGVVKGKAIRTATAVIAKCPAGTAAILWMPVGDKTATITLTSEGADLWDAARDAEQADRRAAYIATPEGKRNALICDVEAAERKFAGLQSSEQTRHADAASMELAAARKALADFDAASPEFGAGVRKQNASDAAMLAQVGR